DAKHSPLYLRSATVDTALDSAADSVAASGFFSTFFSTGFSAAFSEVSAFPITIGTEAKAKNAMTGRMRIIMHSPLRIDRLLRVVRDSGAHACSSDHPNVSALNALARV